MDETEIFQLVTDDFRLDGGSMFGALPKTVWNRMLEADEQNRIPLVTRILVVRHGHRITLVDTGIGPNWSEKGADIYQIKSRLAAPLPEVVPGVTDIVLTHLHFDHAGGMGIGGVDSPQLAFPNARVHLQKLNHDRGKYPGPREKGSYRQVDVGLMEQAKLCLLEKEAEPIPGIVLTPSYGHTRAMQWAHIRMGRDIYVYASDIIPTAHHLHLPFTLGYDMNAEKLMEEKRILIEEAIRERFVIVFAHDKDIAAAKVGTDQNGRFVVKERVELPVWGG